MTGKRALRKALCAPLQPCVNPIRRQPAAPSEDDSQGMASDGDADAPLLGGQRVGPNVAANRRQREKWHRAKLAREAPLEPRPLGAMDYIQVRSAARAGTCAV